MTPIEILKEHCQFNTPFDVYILLAVSRKKEHPGMTTSQEIVFREVISSEYDIEKKYHKMHALTRHYMGGKYSFYVYVTVNPRDVRKAQFTLQSHWASSFGELIYGGSLDLILSKFKDVSGHWMSILRKDSCRGSSKNFMIDLDDPKKLGEVCENLRELTEVIRVTESKQGYHIIVKPFDRTLMPKIEGVKIQTDALTFIEYVGAGDAIKDHNTPQCQRNNAKINRCRIRCNDLWWSSQRLLFRHRTP